MWRCGSIIDGGQLRNQLPGRMRQRELGIPARRGNVAHPHGARGRTRLFRRAFASGAAVARRRRGRAARSRASQRFSFLYSRAVFVGEVGVRLASSAAFFVRSACRQRRCRAVCPRVAFFPLALRVWARCQRWRHIGANYRIWKRVWGSLILGRGQPLALCAVQGARWCLVQRGSSSALIIRSVPDKLRLPVCVVLGPGAMRL